MAIQKYNWFLHMNVVFCNFGKLISSDCFAQNSFRLSVFKILSHANRDSLISCSSGYFISLFVCGPFILLSICGPGKSPQYKAKWKLGEHAPLVPPWNEAPAYRTMQEGCLCHEHAPSWSGSLAVSLLCLEHPSLAFLHRGGEVFLFLYASLNVCSLQ